MTTDYWQLHEDVLFKRAGGRIIWQPRIDCWITDKLFATGHLPAGYDGLSKADIYRKLNCSARIYEYNGCFQPVYPDSIQFRAIEDGERLINRIETPKGQLEQVLVKSPNSWHHRVAKQYVCNEQDLRLMEYVEASCDWRWDQKHYDQTLAEWGRLGAPCIFMPRVSIQRLYIDLMGVEEAIYAVMDYPDSVKAYFRSLRESHLRMIDVINRSPIRIINFGDNIHAGTLSPAWFREYVLEEYQLRCEKLHQGGAFTYAHFDGDNRGLMEFYQETGLDGIEAITPQPQGDVSLEEARHYLGDMFLLDGIPAIYFDSIYPEEVLLDCVDTLIDLFAPNLVLGISDEISSTGDIERIRLVGERVDSYHTGINRQADSSAAR